ncbi:uncharacterized protein [Nicotiana sylvestris]|uniref:uncharacterized protein n=1 Tax=Nicotiana sylvestris TaxID=4096 RepID=UPI00388C4E80
MLHLRQCGSKELVVKMDDKANRRFWCNFFYIKTEHVMANPDGFPEPRKIHLHWLQTFMTGRRASRRVRAPTPAFRQSSTMTGSSLAATAGKSVQTVTSSQTLVLRRPSRRSAAPTAEIPASPVLHLVDESSPSEEEPVPLKRRRVKVGGEITRAEKSTKGDSGLIVAASESEMDLPTMAPPLTEVVGDAPLTEVIVEKGGLPKAAEAVSRSDPSPSRRASVPSSAEEKGKSMAVDDYKTGSDVDPEKVRMFTKGFTRVEKRKAIFKKIERKYHEYRVKNREIYKRFSADDNFQALWDELKQKDDELMRVIDRCSELEGELRVKKDELEVSKGVEAECADLQTQVASLRAELEQSSIKANNLSDEVIEKVLELEKAEKTRVTDLVKVVALEDAIRVLQFEQMNDAEMVALREARLDERIGGLEKDVSNLNDQIAALEAEKAQLLAQPSSSHTSTYPDVS